MKLVKELSTAAIAVLLLTLVLGLAYPLAMTGAAQVLFPGKADGDRSLVGTPRLRGGRPDPRYFQPRPSATGYSATATFFANRGPNSAAARLFYRDQLAAYLKLNPGVRSEDVPVDAVTASASGIDPHISQANARIQARRVAARRGVPEAKVLALVDAHTDGRGLGVFGEPGVNVVDLNNALDKDL